MSDENKVLNIKRLCSLDDKDLHFSFSLLTFSLLLFVKKLRYSQNYYSKFTECRKLLCVALNNPGVLEVEKANSLLESQEEFYIICLLPIGFASKRAKQRRSASGCCSSLLWKHGRVVWAHFLLPAVCERLSLAFHTHPFEKMSKALQLYLAAS